MKVTFFIDRPVFSAVISIVIVIVGIIGLTMLPVDQYPQITPPVVKISASYPGASALTVSQAVATPIETGGIPFAGRGDPEWYFGRKAGSQPVDDTLSDFH